MASSQRSEKLTVGPKRPTGCEPPPFLRGAGGGRGSPSPLPRLPFRREIAETVAADDDAGEADHPGLPREPKNSGELEHGLMKHKRTLTTGEIADYCGVNFRTVIRWIQRGQLRAYQLPGRGDNRVEVHNFIAFLRENQIPIPRDFLHLARKVLIIDDDQEVTRMIQRILRTHDFEAYSADDGFQAGSLLREHLPCVMTVDLNMPGVSGYEVIEHVRLSPELRTTKILVISALPEEDLHKAIRLGADEFLPKPFTPSDLAAKVLQLAGTEIGA